MPAFGRLWLPSASLLWDETRHMVRLRTLRAQAAGRARGPEELLFDEGPVFCHGLAAGLRARDAALAANERTGGVGDPRVGRLIDMVVVLDAPDPSWLSASGHARMQR